MDVDNGAGNRRDIALPTHGRAEPYVDVAPVAVHLARNDETPASGTCSQMGRWRIGI
jgi:hypothetical protein